MTGHAAGQACIPTPSWKTVAYSYTPVNSKHTVEVLVDGGQEDAVADLIIYKNTDAGRPPVRCARHLEGDVLRHRQRHQQRVHRHLQPAATSSAARSVTAAAATAPGTRPVAR
ncbi:MAG: hypothetical protein MZV70_60195 [Desulfobacterales bacterium]|nr:hypothetical protein [Desulfobacterales bacterium]